MEQLGYGKYITDNINRLPFGIPIYTNEIANNLMREFNIDITQAKKIANVNLKRIADHQVLERFQKGIYYKAPHTLFGKTKLNPISVAIRTYVNPNNEIIGYETGPSFLNKIGLTTQIAKNKYFATNLYQRNGSRVDKDLNVAIRKPPIKVTTDNYKYLQLLDAIENKDNTIIDAIQPEKVIFNYIKKSNLDFIQLIVLARKYYKKEVLLQIADIAAIEMQ